MDALPVMSAGGASVGEAPAAIANRHVTRVALRSRMRRFPLAAKRVTILFDIDGTLINSGGAGAASWRLAFDELYGIPADIGEFTDAGMTDPEVGRKTFEAVMHRAPERPSSPGCWNGACTTCIRRSRTRPPTVSCRASRRCCRG